MRWLLASMMTACAGGLMGVGVAASGRDDGAVIEKRVPLSAVTLEQVMGDPEWISRSPERMYWADDGTGLFYLRKKAGSEDRELWRAGVRIASDGKSMEVSGDKQLLSDDERVRADVRSGDVTEDRQWKVYTREGDIWLKNLETGRETALTRTGAGEFGVRFMADERKIAFERDGATLVRELETGLEYQPVDMRFQNEPEEKKDPTDYLSVQQGRLFDVVKQGKERREAAKEREKAEKKARVGLTTPVVYLGEELELREASLSPNGERMLVRAVKKGREGKRETMPSFVTDDGYVRAMPVRTKVGTVERRGEQLFLIDLREGIEDRKRSVELGVLPGVADDPLRAIREAAEAEAAAKEEGKEGKKQRQEKKSEPKARSVTVRDVVWSDDGSRAVVQVFSVDNKDRWIAAVDLAEGKLRPLERIRDEAWINGRFSSLGWLKDGRTVWYVSEESGHAHLYAIDVAERLHAMDEAGELGSCGGEVGKRRLTGWEREGRYEVSDVRLSLDGTWMYFTANIERPGVYELYRAPVASERPAAERLTFLGGQNDFELSPDERSVAILHSDTTTPGDIYVQVLGTGGGAATRVTSTVEDEYAGIEWMTPQVVAVPGREGREIWSRVYAQNAHEGAGKRPAVIFVHGAGYLQDAHEGWSNYFREHMFHNLLANQGYVVIAPDYQASAGYGRDWRTAMYRRMGEPELEDLEDCIAWLAREKNVDPTRVGVYGGSYGGFITLMAMFTKPEMFACGAALRPVTDWAHYNDGYTANILNTPEVDPQAYARSSPIEHAAGLRRPLLICHGMLDDNVFFQDTVRLAQRLIELKKEDWEVAIYPVEPHGFREPTGWLDEYRRIERLFRRHLLEAERSTGAGR